MTMAEIIWSQVWPGGQCAAPTFLFLRPWLGGVLATALPLNLCPRIQSFTASLEQVSASRNAHFLCPLSFHLLYRQSSYLTLCQLPANKTRRDRGMCSQSLPEPPPQLNVVPQLLWYKHLSDLCFLFVTWAAKLRKINTIVMMIIERK